MIDQVGEHNREPVFELAGDAAPVGAGSKHTVQDNQRRAAAEGLDVKLHVLPLRSVAPLSRPSRVALRVVTVSLRRRGR